MSQVKRRCTLFCAIALAFPPTLVSATQEIRRASGPTNPTGESTIHGRVISDRGQPVGRGRITLHSAQGKAAWHAITGARGEFRFERLPAGAYFISMTHPRYVEARPKARGETSRIVGVGSKEAVQVDLTAIRGGAIAGTVWDRFGEPIPDVSVRAYRYAIRGNLKVLIPAEAKSYPSNDLGQYRIANLPSGRYFVAADYRGDTAPGPTLGGERFGFAETWYPGHSSQAHAQSLRVVAGQDRVGTDFVLEPTTFVQISGVVLASSGQPASGAEVSVRPPSEIDTGAAMTGGTRASASGAFVISNLPPGDYLISARTTTRHEQISGSVENIQPEYGRVRVSVGNSSHHGISIHLRPGSHLAGQVIADQIIPPRLTALLLSDDPATRTYRAEMSAERRFSMRVGPGRYRLAMVGLPAGWIIERASLDGQNVSTSPFVISGSSPRLLTVQLSSQGATVAGRVARAISEPCIECPTIVMAENLDERAPGGNGVRLVYADQQGQFRITGLRPGRYFALALPYLDGDALFDEDFWQFVERNGMRLVLIAGEHRQLVVPLGGSYQ